MKIKTNMVSKLLVGAVTSFTLLAPAAYAAISYTTIIAEDTQGDPFIKPVLGGDSARSAWLNVGAGGSISIEDGGTGSTGPTTGGFPGAGSWSGPFYAQMGDESVGITKGPTPEGAQNFYRGADSLYFGGLSGQVNNPGAYVTVTVDEPVVDVKTVIFQLQITEAYGIDFHNKELPTLSYLTGSGTVKELSADFSDLTQIYNGTIDQGGELQDLNFNTYGLQWDLSGVTEEIESFEINFTGVQHAQIYGLQLDQSSESYAGVNLVPEPSGALLGLSGLGLLLMRRRRR